MPIPQPFLTVSAFRAVFSEYDPKQKAPVPFFHTSKDGVRNDGCGQNGDADENRIKPFIYFHTRPSEDAFVHL